MLQRLLLTGLVSGAIAGVLLTAIHMFTVVPLIAEAEGYERAAAAVMHSHPGGLTHGHPGGGVPHAHEATRHGHAGGLNHSHAGGGLPHAHEAGSHTHADGLMHAHGGGTAPHAHEAHAHADGSAHAHLVEEWVPDDGLQRNLFTLLANVLLTIGYGLLMATAFTLLGRRVGLARGLLWGGAGFLCFAFLPALGLPPELPAAAAADLTARQTWWLATAFGSCAGLALVVFSSGWSWRVLGAIILALPHAIGAPHPGAAEIGPAPPELAAQFVMNSLFASAVMWAVLGLSAAYVFSRMMAGETSNLRAPKAT